MQGYKIENWAEWLDSSLHKIKEKNLQRVLRPLLPHESAVEVLLPGDHLNAWASQHPPPSIRSFDSIGLQRVKLFSLNDYLGLSNHVSVRNAYSEAALKFGSGPRASPLVAGYTVYHQQLEVGLAALKRTEDCLLFPTGFAANVAVISSLGSENVEIFSDELNHASIVDGIRLGVKAGATVNIYRHNDMDHLEELLSKSNSKSRKLVIVDSLFSMDGVFAKLDDLARLKKKYGCLLAVDEAHATLCCGETGAGAAEMFGVENAVDLHIGTLSKAFGCVGGFVGCSRQWKDYFVNKSRAQVFSTALPVPVVAAAHAALLTAQNEPWRRKHVWKLAHVLGSELELTGAQSPIIPIVVGHESVALNASAALLLKGFHVPAIRPPTVPPGTSRLRISLSAVHSMEDVLLLAHEINGLQLHSSHPHYSQTAKL